jgi:DNA recombination protein RmuC
MLCTGLPQIPRFNQFWKRYEGLFAEVVRRPGLCGDLQSTHSIMLAGPTTLRALLTSLQLGFRTLAIEKRASEVWQVLSAAKAEFLKYANEWDKLGKQLDTARRTVDSVGTRMRAVERKLRNVDSSITSNSDSDALFSYEADENGEAAELSNDH